MLPRETEGTSLRKNPEAYLITQIFHSLTEPHLTQEPNPKLTASSHRAFSAHPGPGCWEGEVGGSQYN